MARIHGCHVTSREAMFMKYEHYSKCKGSFKDLQRKCKYSELCVTRVFMYVLVLSSPFVVAENVKFDKASCVSNVWERAVHLVYGTL